MPVLHVENVTDLEFEEDLQRHPYNLKYWWRYLEFKHKAPPKVRNLLHERALRCLPGSYKLWFQYLSERVQQVNGRCLDDPAWEAVNNTFERALVFMNKMPRIWVENGLFLTKQCKVTQTRRTLDRALRSLPITQHDRVWKVYLKFLGQEFIPTETAVRCWKRYLQLQPYEIEQYLEYLKTKERWTDVINCLIHILNDPDFTSSSGKTKHDLWVELCNLLSKQNEDLMLDNNLKSETIIRSGISKFSAEVGQLWCALADFNIRLTRFEVARDVYEEGITSVTTVKDFTQIFDAYVQFEETMLGSTSLHEPSASSSSAEEDPATKALMRVCDVDFTPEEEIELRFQRMDHLLARRPELLNSVMLRQNPHNVHEWLNRVKLFEHDKQRMIVVFTEAITTVDTSKAVGKPHLLWIAFAKLYDQEIKDLKLARLIFEKAVKVNFKSVDDLASVWCEYAEMELRHNNVAEAWKLLRRATAVNFVGAPNWKHDPSVPVQSRLWKSVKLWMMYADVDEAVSEANGSGIESTKAIYEKMIDLRVVTPQLILTYASFLQEHNFFEESFKAFEKGIALFKYPQVYDLWITYLSSFMQRFQGTKLERARDLFEQAIKGVPAEHAKRMYFMYAKAEEDYGLTKRALDIYDRATKAVEPGQMIKVFRMYIKKAAEHFGLTSTREIYQKAIESLPDKAVPEMCIKFADMELQLGEVDRARAIYLHCSQFVNPNLKNHESDFWATWHKFEVNFGNEETFREMLRVRRSVTASFNSLMSFGQNEEDLAREKEKSPTPQPQQAPVIDDDEAYYIPAEKYEGSRPGWVFKMDEDGLGYYRDGVDVSRRKRKQLDLEGLAKLEAGARRGDEEIEIEEQEVPSAVLGSLAKRQRTA